MPIEVTWTDDDYDEDWVVQKLPVGHRRREQEEQENYSPSAYSGDDEYELDEEKQSPQDKFEQQWQQFNSVSSLNKDQPLQKKDLPQEEPKPWSAGLELEEEDEPLPEEPTEEIKHQQQSPIVAVETTYKVAPSAPPDDCAYKCGFYVASILLEHCDPRFISNVEDAKTEVTIITEMDDSNDYMEDPLGKWENYATPNAMDKEDTLDKLENLATSKAIEKDDTLDKLENLATPKAIEKEDKPLLAIPFDEPDNQSLDGSMRSTRTTATQETEKTAIETELARPLKLSSRTMSRRTSSFLKWSKSTSSKSTSSKKKGRAPIIIPPVDKEPSSPRRTAVEKELPPPAPLEITTSSLDLQREISLLEFDDADADKNLRIIGLSPTSSFDREDPMSPVSFDREGTMSPTPLSEGVLSEGSYDDEDEATLLSDPRNEHTYMVKAIQSIEVIYDPHLFDEEEEKEDKVFGDGTRYCTLWPVGVKKSRSRGKFYR